MRNDIKLSSAEKVVNFQRIERLFDRLEDEFLRQGQPIVNNLKESARRRLEAGQLTGLFTPTLRERWERFVAERSTQFYDIGEDVTVREVKGVGVDNKPEVRKQLRANASKAVARQQTSLIARMKQVLAKPKATRADAIQAVGSFMDGNTKKMAQATVQGTFNQARTDVFHANSDRIRRYLYSAILDGNEDQTCRDLHGSVLTPEQYARTIWVPPIHFGCRCIYVAVLKDERDPPRLRPLPSRPGGEAEPSFKPL